MQEIRKQEQAYLLAVGERRQACRFADMQAKISRLPDVVEQRQVTYFRKDLL